MEVNGRYTVEGIVVLSVLIKREMSFSRCQLCCYSSRSFGSFAGKCRDRKIPHEKCITSQNLFITKETYRRLPRERRELIL